VVALTALPAIWREGSAVGRLADSLADVVSKVVVLDFLHVRVKGPGQDSRAVRVGQDANGPQTRAIAAALAP
jgi:hypothetical protein